MKKQGKSVKDKVQIAVTFIKTRYGKKPKTREELIKNQKSEYKKMMNFLSKESAYYKDGKNLTSFMDKQTMMDNFNLINTVGIDKNEAMDFAIHSEKNRSFKSRKENITVGLSSGTSSHRGLFLVSNEEENLWAGTVLAKLLPKGNIFNHKVAFFLRANSNLYESVNSKFITFRYYDMYDEIDKNLTELDKYNPSILIAPPSVLRLIGKALKDKKIEIRPLKVISVAEVLEDIDKDYIKEAFNIEVLHQVYQCTEGFLACTCEYGTLHVNEDFIEIKKEYIDEERFIPIITDLKRKSQPVVNYRLNDILVEEKKKCQCESPFLSIKKIEGREDDAFLFKSKLSEEDVLVFSDFISRRILFVDGIEEYRVIQKSRDEMEVLISNLSDLQKEKLVEEFNRLADDLKFVMPKIIFDEYSVNKNKKLRRIERAF